jgi:glycerol kinase
MSPLILAIDQGTSSTKALLFNPSGEVVSKGEASLQTHYLPQGHVEQDPDAILASVKNAVATCLQGQQLTHLVGIGISNQRETFVLWDSEGNPAHPAVVWSCKRSAGLCQRLKETEAEIQQKTGLLIDPYFSGTKVRWLFENHAAIRNKINEGALYFGTIDTWLLYNLTQGDSYVTDHTNASRTLFFNLEKLDWDREILDSWGLENLRLPKIQPSASNFGDTNLFGILPKSVPIRAMIGDSHASLFGEGCFATGDTKITMGTGCSLLSNTGSHPVSGANGLLSTVAWSTQNGVVFAREGAIVACGSVIEWIQGIGLIHSASETAQLAMDSDPNSEVFLIPAFSGLGAPFWQAERMASFHGLRFGTTREDLVRATLESIAFQIKAVLDAFQENSDIEIKSVAIHGGLTQNDWLLQLLSRILHTEIRLQENANISAQGAALLAGLEAGIFEDLNAIQNILITKRIGRITPETEVLSRYLKWLNLITP